MSATERGATERSAAVGSAAPEAQRGGKFLTFFLGDEEYGVEILAVNEIIGLLPVTRVPRTPDFVRGVTNLRGKVIPIVDLRLKFGMPRGEDRAETCIIVVRVRGVQLGVVVDRVSEVLDIPGGDVEDAPEFGAEVDTGYLLGLARTQGRVRLLVDLARVLSTDEIVPAGALPAAPDGA